MTIYHIVYKTTHTNGKYYIGRHTTKNKNDNYLGSGKWVLSIKNKLELSREILTEASSIEELYELEEYYISEHYDDPLCMNYNRLASGWNSSEISEFNKEIQKNGKSRSQNRAKNLYETKRSGLITKNGLNIVYEKTKDGTNPFYKREDGSSVASDRVKSGNHNLVGGVTCYNIKGECNQIPMEIYHSQTGSKDNWEWVSINSNEGKRRANKNCITLILIRDKTGRCYKIAKSLYNSQTGPIENWEWVSNASKEGKRRKELSII